MGASWGVPEATEEFCRQIADGLGNGSPIADYFLGYGLTEMNKTTEAQGLIGRVCKSELGQLTPVAWSIAYSWPKSARRDKAKEDMHFIRGRGSWQWSQIAQANRYLDRSRSIPYSVG